MKMLKQYSLSVPERQLWRKKLHTGLVPNGPCCIHGGDRFKNKLIKYTYYPKASI